MSPSSFHPERDGERRVLRRGSLEPVAQRRQAGSSEERAGGPQRVRGIAQRVAELRGQAGQHGGVDGGSAGLDHALNGSHTHSSLPSPSLLCASTRPPIASTSPRTM
jgi:hypothetical protein